MIAKKNSRYDLERRRTALFFTGLLTAGSFTLAAFNYQSPLDDLDLKRRMEGSSVTFAVEEPIEIPKEEPIIKPIVEQPQTNTSDPSINADPNIGQEITVITGVSTVPDPNVGLDGLNIPTGDLNTGLVDVDLEPVVWADVDAEFIGGFNEMIKYIKTNMVYPQDAIELNEQGRVYLSFVVEKDGTISGINVEQGVYKSIDREAVRIVRNMPKWKPGEVGAKAVRTRVTLPIVFVLE